MMSTITTKGQVTIPSAIRKQFNLCAGDRLDFVVRDGQHVEVIPIHKKMQDLKGALPKPKRAVSLEDMRQAIEGGEGHDRD